MLHDSLNECSNIRNVFVQFHFDSQTTQTLRDSAVRNPSPRKQNLLKRQTFVQNCSTLKPRS